MNDFESPPPDAPPLVEPAPQLPLPIERLPPPVRARKLALYEGAGLGALYAIVFYAVFFKYHLLPTAAFLVCVPTAMGAIPMLFDDEDQIHLYVQLLLRPVMALLGFLVLAGALFREAAICMVVLAVPFLAVSSLVSFLVWAWKARKLSLEKRKKAALLLAVLPLIWAPFEQAFGMPEERRETVSEVEIAAPPADVFARLANVETIASDEYPVSIWDWLSVPRPIRATCDRAAAGGHRVGEFEHGLRFDEVITRWVPDRTMKFSVAVDPRTLREGSAERHAFETGYFRFESAMYRLDPAPRGGTVLTLSSSYTLKSGMNGYGRLWSRALISDFQERVLSVIKRRVEQTTKRAGSIAGAGPAS